MLLSFLNLNHRFADKMVYNDTINFFTFSRKYFWAFSKLFLEVFDFSFRDNAIKSDDDELACEWVQQRREKFRSRSNCHPSEGLSFSMDYFEYWNFVARTCACKMRILIIRPAEEKKSSNSNPKEFLDEFFLQTKICSCFEVKWKTFPLQLIFLAKELRMFSKTHFNKRIIWLCCLIYQIYCKILPLFERNWRKRDKKCEQKTFPSTFYHGSWNASDSWISRKVGKFMKDWKMCWGKCGNLLCVSNSKMFPCFWIKSFIFQIWICHFFHNFFSNPSSKFINLNFCTFGLHFQFFILIFVGFA